MLAAAAHALADLVDMEKPGASVLPPVREMGDFTKILAEKVVRQAVQEGLNGIPVENPKEAIEDPVEGGVQGIVRKGRSPFLSAVSRRRPFDGAVAQATAPFSYPKMENTL